MGRLDREARNAMAVLLDRGHTKSSVACLPGVSEGTVRYHDRRLREGAVDGRSRQQGVAVEHAAAIAHWRELQGAGAINLAALHAWLLREPGYGGSLRSVQRHWKRTYPAPAHRARRRAETPPGAQAQVDWAHFRGVRVGPEPVALVAFHMVRSWSRKEAVEWARGKDMLAWLSCHTAGFERLGEDAHGDLPGHRPGRTGQDASRGVTGDGCHLTDARQADAAARSGQVLTATPEPCPSRQCYCLVVPNAPTMRPS